MKRVIVAAVLVAMACAKGEVTDSTTADRTLVANPDSSDAGTAREAPRDATAPDGRAPTCVALFCPPRANSVMTCDDAGACAIGSCTAHHADCNHDTSDGCEVDLETDVTHCGACDKACTAAPNALSACASGACGVTCAPGFATVGGVCASFGGAYESSDPGCPACASANTMAGTCGCPVGFTSVTAGRVLNDCSGAHGGVLSFCQAAGSAAGDWGGAYQMDDAAGSCPQGCRTPNPYTHSCGCPAGATPIALRTAVDTPCGELIGSHLTLCLYAAAPTTTFAGAYEVDDPVAGNLGCRVPNPVTNGCTCPAGTTARDYRALVDISGGNVIGSKVSVCTRP